MTQVKQDQPEAEKLESVDAKIDFETSQPTEVEGDKMQETCTEISSIVPSKNHTKKKRKTGTRTPSSYVLFSMDYRKIVSTEHPSLSLGEISKKCGEKWKDLPEDEKNSWKLKADTLKEEKQATIEHVIKKKRKPSSYLMFSMDYRKEITKSQPTLALGEVSRLCGAKWKSMTDDEKKVWKDKALVV